MKWSCGHEGHLNLDWLKRNNYSSKTLEKGRKDSTFLFAKQVHKLKVNTESVLRTDSVFCFAYDLIHF